MYLCTWWRIFRQYNYGKFWPFQKLSHVQDSLYIMNIVGHVGHRSIKFILTCLLVEEQTVLKWKKMRDFISYVCKYVSCMVGCSWVALILKIIVLQASILADSGNMATSIAGNVRPKNGIFPATSYTNAAFVGSTSSLGVTASTATRPKPTR